MKQKPPEGKISKQEKLQIEIRLAGPKDWQAYKELRLEAINGPDENMFGPVQASRDRLKSDQDWQNDLLPSLDKFTVLLWINGKAVGIGLARKRNNEDTWFLNSGYIKPEFRGGLGRKLLASRLDEIEKRGGYKVDVLIRVNNAKSIHLCESFGFVKQNEDTTWYAMELDLNDPSTKIKIQSALNAG